MCILHAPEPWTLGDCLNAGIDTATGTYIAKMDDDDFYGSHHLTDLLLAMDYSNADIVGKWAEFVYLEYVDLTVHRETDSVERSKTHVGGPTMLMLREIAEDFRYLRLPQAIDVTLYERVIDAGGQIYSTHPYDFALHRHSRGHTWETGHEHFFRSARNQWSGLAWGEFSVNGPLEEEPR